MGEQRVSGEEGGRFVIGLVGRGASAPQIVVVQTWQIVVDERIGVHTFNRDRRGKSRFVTGAKQLCRGEHQYGAQAFAATFYRVAHRFVDAGRPGCGRREMRIEAMFDASMVSGELIGKTHSSKEVSQIMTSRNPGDRESMNRMSLIK